MNPPSALNSAMSRDRKPFTYTPGGIDLSEIKSQRMAQRLMRNAMNPGVPEVPVHPVLTSGTPTVPIAVPNYNCLPVQVFPAMPANPRTLLRTRSNPDREAAIQRVNPPSFVNNTKFENNDTLYKNTPAYSQQINNNRHNNMSMSNYSTPPANAYNAPRLNYGSDGNTAPVTMNLPAPGEMPTFAYAHVAAPGPAPVTAPVSVPVFTPKSVPAPEPARVSAPVYASVTAPVFTPMPISAPEPTGKSASMFAPISVSAPVFAPVAAPMNAPVFAPTSVTGLVPEPVYDPLPESAPVLPEISYEAEFCGVPKTYSELTNEQLPKLEKSEEKDKVPTYDNVETSIDLTVNQKEDDTVNLIERVTVNPIRDVATVKSKQEETDVPTPLVTKSFEENADIDNEQREVKVVKKQVAKTVEEQNGEQNGDANGEAEMTVKLPAKKSGAKTETKVEVEKKVLPDGSIEEIKTTTTKTTIDGRTEIKTKTETTITPKEEESEEEVEEEEEEVVQEAEAQQEEETEDPETVTVTQTVAAPKENGNVIKKEERSETTVAKKVVVVQEIPQPEEAEEVEEEEEIEEEDEETAEPVTIVLKKQPTPEPKVEAEPDEEEVEEEEEEVEEVSKEVKEGIVQEDNKQEVETQIEEEVKEKVEVEEKKEVAATPVKDDQEDEEEEEYEEAEEEKEEVEVKVQEKTEVKQTEEQKEEEIVEEEVKEETISKVPIEETKEAPKKGEHVIPIQIQASEDPKTELKEEKPEHKPTEFTIPIREPSIPLDKVEDVEIKPISMTPIISKTHTENTEIITSTLDPAGGVSKQTEYNKIENIVTVNRTTKILDHSYENITQQGIPTVKTYFAPPSMDRISTSPMPSRPYQPVYPPEPTTERRHSLLLERLSMERQLPTDIYNQTYDQSQYQSEPQSEVLTVSNIKPSQITNQQWYQQNKQTENLLYNNVTSTPTPVGAPWAQPKSPQPQQQYQHPSQPQPQPHYQAQYQPPPQPQFQRGTTPQPQYQKATTPQPQYQQAATPQPKYHHSYSEPTHDRTPANNYSTYTPTPTWVASAVETTPNQYSSYTNNDTTQSYQKNTFSSSSQQYSSGYVPPPWEQDSSYTSVNNTSEKFCQEIPQTNTYSSAPSQGWKPTPPPAKFNKNAPIAYVPPAPNQSFVAPVSEPPKQPGRKTYYSEYERRYISVPESTYIPTETKYQPQPDPSPQYYYDNNEPSETVEPQWRKELREFTEKTSQTITTEQTNVHPPWESDSKYAKTPSSTYTPTPTWSQTLRPQSYHERSFESEFVSQEWPKTNTLGRGRPMSTMGKSADAAVPERARGVSVDRYNPNNYQPPAEHPPVQSHMLTTPVPHASYHNPNVPAYHARASAEPREQPTNYQQRVYRESRASPLQSRSFKYLQWITGTEN